MPLSTGNYTRARDISVEKNSPSSWLVLLVGERRSRSFGVRSTEDERLAAITTARIARAYKTPTQAGM